NFSGDRRFSGDGRISGNPRRDLHLRKRDLDPRPALLVARADVGADALRQALALKTGDSLAQRLLVHAEGFTERLLADEVLRAAETMRPEIELLIDGALEYRQVWVEVEEDVVRHFEIGVLPLDLDGDGRNSRDGRIW